MLIALYPHHHSLPFWHSPEQPELLFDPRAMAKWRWKSGRDEKIVPLKKTGMWPVLMGLHLIEMRALAHVSAFYPANNNTIGWAHRIWIQITTMPLIGVGGIPVVVNDGRVLVEPLWGGDNGTYTPYQLIGEKPVPGDETPEFWKKFFLDQLLAAKQDAIEKAQRAAEKSTAIERRFALV